MSDVTLEELISIIQLFCEERDWDQYHNPKDLAIGISTEANGLLDIFRFKSEESIMKIMENPEDKELVEDEISAVLFFVLRFAQMNHIDLKKALIRKVEKSKSTYPVAD